MMRSKSRSSSTTWLLGLLACLSLLGCQKKGPKPTSARQSDGNATRPVEDQAPAKTGTSISLHYAVVIPKDIPKRMKFHPKFAKPYVGDAHAMYRRSHKAGWDQCVRAYLRGKLTASSKAMIMTQFGLMQRADQAGFKQCRNEINVLTGRHGAARVKAALTQQHRALLK